MTRLKHIVISGLTLVVCGLSPAGFASSAVSDTSISETFSRAAVSTKASLEAENVAVDSHAESATEDAAAQANDIVNAPVDSESTDKAVAAVADVSPIQRANANVNAGSNVSPAAVGSAQHLMNVVLGLGAIIALILGLSWFAKRFGQGNFSGGSVMKVVATLPLGTRERLLLVEVGGKHILLGVTPTAINSLHSFDEPVIVPARQEPSEFARKLMSVIQQKNTADSNEKPLS